MQHRLLDRQAQQGFVLVNEKLEMVQKIHTRQPVHAQLTAQDQHTDFELINLPVTHREGIEFIYRRLHIAVGSHQETL